MDKKLRLNIILLIIVIGLAGFLITSNNKPEVNEQKTVSSVTPETIQHIRIERDEKPDIVFDKKEDMWKMTSPLTAIANLSRINAMLHLLQTRSFAQLYAKGLNLRRFDLRYPAVTLYLNEYEFFFGDTNPLEDRRYILFEDTIHLINDSLFHQLTQDSTFFINPRLLPDSTKLIRLQLPDITLNLDGAIWHSSDINTDNDSIVKVINAWLDATAAVEMYEAAKSTGTVVVTTARQHTIRFEIVSPLPDLVLARIDLGIQYRVTPRLSEQLFINR